MRSKDHLFHLIKSLSKSEKRYFTLDAQKSGRKQSRYLNLFKAINEQDSYSEAPLKKLFGSKLGDDKARLYEAILRSMRDYQSKKSYKTRIKELLTDAKILFERKLYEQAENRLTEAKSLALELEDHLVILEINLRERQLIKEYQHRNYAQQVEKLIEEKDKHLKILEEEFWLNDTYDRISIDMFKYHNKVNEEKAKDLKENYAEILEKRENIDSFYALWRIYKMGALYYRLLGEYDKEFSETMLIDKLWKENDKILQDNYFQYLGDAFNLVSAMARNKELIHELPKTLEDINNNSSKFENAQAKKLLFEKTSIYRLIYLLNTNSTSFDKELNDIETGLKRFNITPSSELSIIINTVLLLFLSDQYDKCINWLEKLWKLQRRTKEIRQDIQNNSRIIYLLATYKIKSYEKTENVLRSVKRYFNNAKIKSKNFLLFYQLIIDAINKTQAAVSSREEKNSIVHLKEQILALEAPLPGGIDEITVLWAESIINNKDISKIRKL